MAFRIGIDVGGTFTDFLVTGPGRAVAHKQLSTPSDPSLAVMSGLGAVAATLALPLERFLERIALIVHGTTVTTNAVLTGNTARTGLVTTRGFRDALQMRRGIREEMYDNRYHPPAPLVARHLRLPVTERIDAEGSIVQPLAAGDVEEAAAQLRDAGVQAVAICFLHAHANAAHEQVAASIVRERLPEAYVSISSEVLPQIRFYERTSTTVLNAAVGPILARYMGNLTRNLADSGFRGKLLVMQSNGGVAAPASIARLAAMTLLSGPAAAPAAGLACMAPRRERSFITVDMGGTSFDAALVRNGTPAITTRGHVNRYALALPSMEINTIGAGGGSIAWIDEGGLLHMGPQSAGADPGPACYGRGGRAPTCTDANLVLGYLSADFFAGGRIPLDHAAAGRAIRDQVAKPLGMDVLEAAAGMFHVINVNMASAIREISVEKGYDPREFPLLCAGGAGPVHGACIAEELGIRQVIVPRDASIFCAAGMLRSDLKHDYVRSCARILPADRTAAGNLRDLVRQMQREARATLAGEGIPRSRQRMRYTLDLRYLGQYHEVSVEIPQESLLQSRWQQVRERFHAEHDRLYGYSLREEQTPVEMLSVRLGATGVTAKPAIPRAARVKSKPAPKNHRLVYLADAKRLVRVAVFDGDRLTHGQRIAGPAILESVNTSIFVPRGWRAEYDALDNCVLRS